MAFITEADVTRVNLSRGEKARLIESSPSQATIDAFLSHSHHDRDMVMMFIDFMARVLNVSIYVDWADTAMPRVTSGITADQIKSQIEQHPLFFVFGTDRAFGSRWVPWEVGIADAKKTRSHILIWPVTNSQPGTYLGNEYLSVYPYVDKPYTSSQNLQVVTPGGSPMPLATWIESHVLRLRNW